MHALKLHNCSSAGRRRIGDAIARASARKLWALLLSFPLSHLINMIYLPNTWRLPVWIVSSGKTNLMLLKPGIGR